MREAVSFTCHGDVSNPPKLKLVMLFNVQNQTYWVCSHNLSAEKASQELEKLRHEGLPAFRFATLFP